MERVLRSIDRAALPLMLLALWPVWQWYAQRMVDGSDEPWGVAALATGLSYVVLTPKSESPRPLPISALLVLTIYVLLFPVLPALLKATLAIVCLTLAISALRFGKFFHLGLAALLFLSLPIIASLQFYLGYPLRVLTGEIVAWLLWCCGEIVVAKGTSLWWRGDLLSIDAPCSGIKMLWGGLYVCFSLACFLELSNRGTLRVYTLSALSIFCANVLRTFILFFSETRILVMPEWFHSLVGILCFSLAILSIVFIIRQRRSYEATVASC